MIYTTDYILGVVIYNNENWYAPKLSAVELESTWFLAEMVIL
jgi:hypothetical protein